MNRKIGILSSLVNLCAVAGFVLCILLGSDFGSYITSMFIAMSFAPMMCAFEAFAPPDRNVAGKTAAVFAGAYLTLILLVYFAQVTAVRLNPLSDQAAQILDYQRFGLFFSFDLLGYGMMALATFFAGLTIAPETKGDRWLRGLLMIHGVFFFTCLILPMLGVFSPGMEGGDMIGSALMLFWCAYFIPVGVLSTLRFFRLPE